MALSFAFAVLIGTCAVVAAQGEGPANKPRLLDRVVVVIGDKAVLESSVRTELEARISGVRGRTGQDPTPEEREAMRAEILRNKLEQEVLAQSARTMPGSSRERVDQYLEDLMRDYERQETERAGSLNKLSGEFPLLGTTWDSVYEERRTRELADLTTRHNLQRRFRDQFALMVTPTQMRQWYDEHLDEFRQPKSADVAIVTFAAETDRSAALARAQAAASAWSETEATAAEIAARFQGLALSNRIGVRDAPEDQNVPAIKAFAATAAAGAVSPLIERGSSYWVLKLVQQNPERDEPFSDPEVQARILDHLILDQITKLRARLALGSRYRPRPFLEPVPQR